MKRTLLILLTLLLALSCSAVCAAAAEAPVTTVVCVGDSITFGAGVTGRENTYPAMLQTMLGEGFVVKNCGENGRTLQREGMLNPPDASFNFPMTFWDSRVMNAAVEAAPDIVIIMLGTNDAKAWNWNAENYTGQYVELIRFFRSLPGEPQVFAVIPPPGFDAHEGVNAADPIDREILAALGDCIREAAQACGCPVIDLYSAFEGRGDLFPDGIHPNAEGNRILARQIYEALTAEAE
ncbi:MAG: hypothetical protein IKH77_03095 [Clostridia bacterium]|nr:hypothetical protein [Clostridia bacterium]